MAGRLLAFRATRSLLTTKPPMSVSAAFMSDLRTIIGNREVVGYGFNGQPNYVDRAEYPLPAIRWKESSPDICALREKEKGDWRKLSTEEKKALYRASFCQTFAEFQAPTGEWKLNVGYALVIVSIAFTLYYGVKAFVHPPLPDSFKEENRRAQLRRIIDLQINPVTGISSKWDYEKDDWKK